MLLAFGGLARHGKILGWFIGNGFTNSWNKISLDGSFQYCVTPQILLSIVLNIVIKRAKMKWSCLLACHIRYSQGHEISPPPQRITFYCRSVWNSVEIAKNGWNNIRATFVCNVHSVYGLEYVFILNVSRHFLF